MAETFRWGVLSTARIATEKVIPAIAGSQLGDVVAIASRSPQRAAEAAEAAGIEVSYGSYEELLADSTIDGVYNPLPNHLHVPLTLQAAAAGKHVLCEKPIALDAAEATQLVQELERHPDVVVMEAFMYRFHPQWEFAKRLVTDGTHGALRSIQTWFSYFNDDPDNIRHVPDWGGGGLMDIGCYPISQARWLFDAEPARVVGVTEIDPRFGTDRVASAVLDFGTGTATFTCSTQLPGHQRANIFFDRARLEIEVPVNVPPDVASRVWLHTDDGAEEITFPPADQYGRQADAFVQAVRDEAAAPTPLDDAVANMVVLDAVAESATTGSWVTPAT